MPASCSPGAPLSGETVCISWRSGSKRMSSGSPASSVSVRTINGRIRFCIHSVTNSDFVPITSEWSMNRRPSVPSSQVL